jgi:uncharacterized protein
MSQPTHSARYYIDALQLSPHPEGGYYRETYRASLTISASALPSRFRGERACSTGIFYLLEQGDYSAFHRIQSDEMWHFYAGDPLEVHCIDSSGHYVFELGHDLALGQHLQCVVPAGAWFAAAPKEGSRFTLVGCTVSPGFDFADFTMASGDDIKVACPQKAQQLLARFPPRAVG